jgi:hypothetical protein
LDILCLLKYTTPDIGRIKVILGRTKIKIGLSYSRCVLDIVEERVDMEDVLVVISRTDFDPNIDEQWSGIWDGYRYGGRTNPEWANSPYTEDQFRATSIQLWSDGKLHQPRKFGAYGMRRPEYWLETCLPDSELDRNPAAKLAWDNFQVIAGLSNVSLDKTYK